MSESKNASKPNKPQLKLNKSGKEVPSLKKKEKPVSAVPAVPEEGAEVMSTCHGFASSDSSEQSRMKADSESGSVPRVNLTQKMAVPRLSSKDSHGKESVEAKKPSLKVGADVGAESGSIQKPSLPGKPKPPKLSLKSSDGADKTMALSVPQVLKKTSTEAGEGADKTVQSGESKKISTMPPRVPSPTGGEKTMAMTAPSLPNSDKTMALSAPSQGAMNKTLSMGAPTLPNSDKPMALSAPPQLSGDKKNVELKVNEGLTGKPSLPPPRPSSGVKADKIPSLKSGNLPLMSVQKSLEPVEEGEEFQGELTEDALELMHDILESAGQDLGMTDEQELPEAWLKGGAVSGGSAELQRSVFSSPNLLPAQAEQEGYAEASDNLNVDLEKGEGLPDELEDIIAGYDDEIRHVRTQDGIRECTIQLAIARILEHTGYEKLAYVRYLKALEANHFSRSAIHELRRIARAYNKTKDVLTLLQSDIDTDLSAEEQSVLLEECALITYFGEEPHKAEAIAMMYRACALAPQRISAVCTLFYLLLFEHRYKECCDTLDKLIGLTDERELQVACHTLKADIESSLKHATSEILTSYLHALELSPGSLYAYFQGITHLIRQGAWQTIFAVSNAFADASRDKQMGCCALLLAGSVSNDLLSDNLGSRAAYEQALKYQPNDVLPLELILENIADDPAQWQACDHVLFELGKATEVPRERLEMALMRAMNLDQNGKALSAAIDVVRDILREIPHDRLTLEYYIDLLQRDGRLEEAMQINQRIAEISNTEEAAERLADLGCYCYDVLKKYQEAEQNFRSALMLDPGQRTAFEYLEQILRSRNDYEGIVRMYRMRLETVQDARIRASLCYTLATLYDYNLGQVDNAISYYRQYREIYPDDFHAIHNLQRLYHKIHDWKSLIEMLLAEKDYAATPTERCDILLRISNICRYKMNRNHYAVSFLHQARQENPKNLAVYHELYAVLSELRSWKELIEILEIQLTVMNKPDEKLMTLFSMSHVYEDMLCDVQSAVSCYEQILSIEPDNTVAMTKLSHIYRTSGNLAAYYELTLDKAQHLPLPQARARLLFRVALKTLTLFKEPEQAVSILEMALSHDPNYVPVVFLLALLYGSTARYESQAGLIQELTNTIKNQSTKSASAMLLAYLYTWMIQSPDDAIHPLELALALSPDAMNARIMLVHSQFNRQQMTELAPLFAEGAQNTKDKAIAAHDYNLAAFIAHAYPATNGAFENEVSSLKSTLELDPDNIMANERLEAMEPCRANLVPFLERRLKRASQEDKIEIQVALVESIYPDLPQQAFSMICDVVEENPSHLPALRIATNMARKMNNPQLLSRFLSLQAQCLENMEMRVITWCEAARIARDQLNHIDMAIDYFKQAFMLAPQRMDLCDQLLDLLRRKRDVAAIDSILQIHTRSISPDNQMKRFIQMAEDYLNEFHEPVQAAVKLRQVLEIDPSHVEVLWKLAQIEVSLNHWNEARNALERILEQADADENILLTARLYLANIYIDNLGMPRHALPLLQDILKANPNDTHAMERMADIYFMESRLQEALELLLRLKTMIEPPQNIRVLLQIANIYKSLNEQDKLANIMREAASLVPLRASILNDVHPWIMRCNEPAVILAFVEKLLEIRDVPTEVMVSIYEFVAYCYGGPLHRRFEADKYAVAAANLAPNSFQTRLLAARVFDPKEAMSHASAAAALSPFRVEPYQAMLDIAKNANRFDLQARVEQQLMALAAPIQPTESLQSAYHQRYPMKPDSIDDNIIRLAQTVELNPNVQMLLKLAGAKAQQIFALPERHTDPITMVPALASLFFEIANVFGIQGPDAQVVQDAPFIFSACPDNPGMLLLNASAFASASEAEKRFHMAAAMTHLKLGTLPLVTLPHENIIMVISGLLGLYDEKLAMPDVLSRIKSFLPRHLRKTIVEFITTQGIASFQYDPIQLQYAASVLDANIGHLFSADLCASIMALMRRKKPNLHIPAQPQQLLAHYANMPNVPGLFAFNTSERFSEMRQQLGLFLKMTT